MTSARPSTPPLVIDASVALKWELDDEEYVEQALALRDEFLSLGSIQLFAPHLYIYELTNGVVSAVNRQRIESMHGAQILRRLLLAGVSLQAPPVGRTYDIALEYNLSAYDGSYVALAEALTADLWTADRKLYESAVGGLPWVRWISDYPS